MKKLINYAMAAFLAVALLGVTAVNGQEWTKEQLAVWNEVEKGWEAYKAGDSEAAFAGIHDKYLGWNNEEPLPIPKDKWKKSYEMNKQYMTIEQFDIQPARIVVHGNNAVVYYFFEIYSVFQKDDKKKSYEVEGRNVEFYVKEGGKWMMLGDMTCLEEDD